MKIRGAEGIVRSLAMVLGVATSVAGWGVEAGQLKEEWECGSFFEVNVTLVADVEKSEGVIEVHGLSQPTRFVIRGLDREWTFGDQESYSFVIGPDLVGRYYDFSGRPDERIPPSQVFSCARNVASMADGVVSPPGSTPQNLARAAPVPKRKPKPPPDAFDTLLRDLDRQRKTAAPKPRRDRAKPSARPAPRRQDSLTQKRLISALVQQIRDRVVPCWNPQIGIKDAHKLRVEISIRLNPDGTLIGSPRIVDRRRLAADPVFRAYAESAKLALQNPRCQPLRLPLDSYKVWQAISFNFDTRELLR